AVPNRMGLSTRLRMPFYLFPADLLLLSPIYFVSPATYTNMAVVASNGGLIPWQAGIATPIGRFQFVLGRELGVTFYGVLSNDSLIAPATAPGALPTVVDFKSTFDTGVTSAIATSRTGWVSFSGTSSACISAADMMPSDSATSAITPPVASA